eukprot:GHVN01053705.1.p2 GENE.GHVN01053705.1~~GHVN01053705.1.p2  ORF type:complete len:101 (-),score=15.20 GHVN01053705.1:400-702(-)
MFGFVGSENKRWRIRPSTWVGTFTCCTHLFNSIASSSGWKRGGPTPPPERRMYTYGDVARGRGEVRASEEAEQPLRVHASKGELMSAGERVSLGLCGEEL